jgi:hypothetical protein
MAARERSEGSMAMEEDVGRRVSVAGGGVEDGVEGDHLDRILEKRRS